MKKVLSVLSLALVSAATSADQAELMPNRIVPTGGGVLIGFDQSDTGFPVAACEHKAGFKGTQAVLSIHMPEYAEALSLINDRMMKGQTVVINYSDPGDCSTADTLLRIVDVY